jgi:hypothetical protein
VTGGIVVKRDSLLGHCIARAVVAEHGGIEAAVEKYGPRAERLSKWSALKVGAKIAPKAARVAGFIIFWAVALQIEERDEFSITEYQRYWREGERQTYRLQREFRELWPEYETPNELALQIVKQVGEKSSKRDIAALPSQVFLTA